MSHDYVIRTNEKGKPFIGECQLCGKTGLTKETIRNEDCPRTLKLSQDECLVRAIKEEHPYLDDAGIGFGPNGWRERGA